MATGGGDSDDDPMGRIPTAPIKNQVEISISSNQFNDEKETHEMSTSYEPPISNSTADAPDDDVTSRMLKRLEEEMTKGRKGGMPSSELDQMMYQIS